MHEPERVSLLPGGDVQLTVCTQELKPITPISASIQEAAGFWAFPSQNMAALTP